MSTYHHCIPNQVHPLLNTLQECNKVGLILEIEMQRWLNLGNEKIYIHGKGIKSYVTIDTIWYFPKVINSQGFLSWIERTVVSPYQLQS